MNAPLTVPAEIRPISIREEKRLWRYLIAQLISLTGTLLQGAALSRWAVEKVGKENSGPIVGMIWALGFVLGAVLGPVVGQYIDRANKHRVLIITSVLGFVQAALLAYMHYLGWLNIATVYVLALAGGLINAVDVVIRNAFVRHIVEDHNMHRAVSMFVALYNFALMLGPGLVAVLKDQVGYTGIFSLNALSFVILIALVWNIPVPHVCRKETVQTGVLDRVKSGAKYVFLEDKQIRFCWILIALMSIFGMTVNSMLSVVAANMFRDNTAVFSLLARTLGLGSLVGSVLTIVLSERWPRTFIVIGLCLMGLSLCVLSQLTIIWQGQLALFVSGVALMMCFSTTQALLQKLGKKRMQGTIVGWRNTAFFGGWMIGSIVMGYIAKILRCPTMLNVCGLALFTIGVIVLLVRPDFTQHQDKTQA